MSASLEAWQLAALGLLGILIYFIYRHQSRKINVPSVGVPPGILGPWRAALNFTAQSESLIQEGYRKYGKTGQAFKISTPARYVVLFTDPKMVRELANADPKILSFRQSAFERVSMPYTFSKDLEINLYHVDIISKNLTTRLGSIMPEVMSELIMSFEENINIGREWASVDNFNVMLKCLSRTTNRLFVGLPLCRDQDYLNHCLEFSTNASFGGATIDIFPAILKPFIAKMILKREKALQKVLDVVGPIFEERRQKLQKLGEKWVDRPNDAIQWIVEAAPPGTTIEDMCVRILFLNFAGIHTTSIVVTQVIYDLAAHPEFQDPLRQEVEMVIAESGGWTMPALTKMKKIDSVLRETQRLSGVTQFTGLRGAVVSHTFSDGTHVPKGTWVLPATSAIHRDPSTYENANEWDGFRFSRMREQKGQETKHQMASVTNDNLIFGTGKHSCPGRFFVAGELKLFLAYILCNYEFKFGDGKKPQNTYSGYSCIPNLKAKVLYRERQDRKKSFANSCFVTGI